MSDINRIDTEPRLWQTLEELEGATPSQDEFPELLPLGEGAGTAPRGVGRRDFLRFMGLSSAAMAAACKRAPVRKAVPYATAPEDLVPGVATWYASACGGCAAACGVLVKTRDGRPIKIEGNPEHPISQGGVCAMGQATVLALYDAAREKGPSAGGKNTTWAELDARVGEGLRAAESAGKGIRLVTPPVVGPTHEAAIARFLAKYPSAKRVVHDPLGDVAAIAAAHKNAFGKHAVPVIRLERAKVVASFAADFLGTWISPVSFTRGYTAARDVERGASRLRHVHFEPHLSLTGARADERHAIAPSDLVPALGHLAARLGVAVPALPAPAIEKGVLDRLATELGAARGAALLLCGSDDVAAQVLAAAINQALGAYGNTLDIAAAAPISEGMSIGELLAELSGGKIGAVIFDGTNPVYGHPQGAALAAALANVDITVSTSDRRDETARALRYLAPDHHALEAWSDSETTLGTIGVAQPVIRPLYDTRPAVESLLAWAGEPKPHYDFLRARWEAELLPKASVPALTFAAFWQRSLRDGFTKINIDAPQPLEFNNAAVAGALAGRDTPPARAGLELWLHANIAMGDGSLANNAWLQELPDPITKLTWGNAAALAPATAKSLGLNDGDLISLEIDGARVALPALAQPGVHPAVVAVALGYGRAAAGTVAKDVGKDATPLATTNNGRMLRARAGVSVRRAEGRGRLARAQVHPSQEGRPLARVVPLAHPEIAHEAGHDHSMWSGHKYEGHRWAMAVDLDACTGCSACVVSCQAENNIPTVGPDEVIRQRSLHWMRIDRYYEGSAEAPRVIHQPMMCQHCENAPCETVCPVLATVHSSEGLNQQVYNRCVGTRYCANNCPIKTRRFNWFDYSHEENARLVLNPDVTVRSRGVMEKCSFCIQRIQAAKTSARNDGRAVGDGEVKTACQQSCPANAIVFGDLNDPKSALAKLVKSGRGYRLLPQLNLGNRVVYLARVRPSGGGE